MNSFHFRARIAAAIAITALAVAISGCGASKDETAAAPTAATGQYANVQNYLLDHTGPLNAKTIALKQQGSDYYNLMKSYDFDYAQALKEDPEAVQKSVEEMQTTWQAANPLYEQAEGVVAGVPELADYDVILDAGASAEDDPEGAVPFNLTLPNGKVEKQPGNFFYLTETSLWGTEDKFTAQGVKPDLNGDGKVEFGEALPEANHIKAATADFQKYTDELNVSSQKWTPSDEDVFTALVVMTPTMAEYFDAWKNSRFVAGDKATEASFVGSSRLNDITDILTGLVLVYENINDQVAKQDPEQAKQIGTELTELRDFAADLRDREADGEKFTAEQADTLGAEAQERAERIAGQVSQAAAKLNIQVEN